MQTQKQTAPVQGKVAWLWACKARPPRETVSNRKSWPKARHVAVAASRARSKLGRTKRDPRAWQDGRGPLVRALGLDCPKPARSSAHAQNVRPPKRATPSVLHRMELTASDCTSWQRHPMCRPPCRNWPYRLPTQRLEQTQVRSRRSRRPAQP